MIDIKKIEPISKTLKTDLNLISNSYIKIKEILYPFSDKKNLKGEELTAWLGEIYAKILYDGILVDEKQEHDFIVEKTGKRYAVKARKENKGKKGWTETSAISKIKGDDCPHFLLFIHFNKDYEIQNIWEYPWPEILEEGRFENKTVRKEGSRWFFTVNPIKDKERLVYPIK